MNKDKIKELIYKGKLADEQYNTTNNVIDDHDNGMLVLLKQYFKADGISISKYKAPKKVNKNKTEIHNERHIIMGEIMRSLERQPHNHELLKLEGINRVLYAPIPIKY